MLARTECTGVTDTRRLKPPPYTSASTLQQGQSAHDPQRRPKFQQNSPKSSCPTPRAGQEDGAGEAMPTAPIPHPSARGDPRATGNIAFGRFPKTQRVKTRTFGKQLFQCWEPLKKIKEQQRGARDGLKAQGEGSDMGKMQGERIWRRKGAGGRGDSVHPAPRERPRSSGWPSKHGSANNEEGREATTCREGEERGKGQPERPRAPSTTTAECTAPARGRGPAFLPHNTMPNLTGGEEPGELFAGGRLASGANLSPRWASSPCTRRAPARQASPQCDVSPEQQSPGGQRLSIRGPIFTISRKPLTFFFFFFVLPRVLSPASADLSAAPA